MPKDDSNPPAHDGQALRLPPRAKTYDPAVRTALTTYKADNNLTNAELGIELGGIGVTQVSKYLNGTPDFDVTRLEQAARDVLQTAPTRRKLAKSLFATDASIEIHTTCELIRETNDIGLIHGPAGSGKTKGIDLYCASHPLTLRVTLSKWDGGPGGLEAAIFGAMDTRTHTRRERRSTWLRRMLKGSNRLLIVDNAHRLTRSALAWLFDFWDDTNLPIALVGNPEVLELIKENDQQFSRIGTASPVAVEDATSFARSMLRLHCPQHEAALLKLATTVMKEQGHGRALFKHLILMPKFMEAAGGDARMAFKMAHTKQVSAYKLDGEDVA
jgi:DNA transposition AAA+ family ATPase